MVKFNDCIANCFLFVPCALAPFFYASIFYNPILASLLDSYLFLFFFYYFYSLFIFSYCFMNFPIILVYYRVLWLLPPCYLFGPKFIFQFLLVGQLPSRLWRLLLGVIGWSVMPEGLMLGPTMLGVYQGYIQSYWEHMTSMIKLSMSDTYASPLSHQPTSLFWIGSFIYFYLLYILL